MAEYWKVILDALSDTAKILPLLFIVYYLIELIEFKYAIKIQNNKWLKGNASPVFGAVIGCVPQCGFSVVSTDLYTRGSLSCGALVAVYIATSDEAIPLMIANPSKIGWLLALICIKIVFGIAVGYLAMMLFNLIFKKRKSIQTEQLNLKNSDMHSHENYAQLEKHDEEAQVKTKASILHQVAENEQNHAEIDNQNKTHIKSAIYNAEQHSAENLLKNETEEHENSSHNSIGHGGCCHHHVETKSYDWLHPLLHCLKISLFILIINLIFGCITEIWIGKDALKNFLDQSIYLQPILAILIGLIPNCASSVVLTELFLIDGIAFGSLVAGLCVNAGLGLIMLFKQNKNVKENIFIISMLIVPSLILGYLINLFVLL